MLGHASAAMTFDVYSGLFDDDLDAAADRLDGAARDAAVPPVCPEVVVTPITQGETGIGPAMLMEPPSGFEPETYALRVRCSGQLS